MHIRDDDLLAVRTRWQEIGRAPRQELLRIALLASYTIDPVLPYLGVALEDAGLPAAFHVGPFNQIVQQCLDEESATARHRPDVLIVAPRLEELGADYPAELAHVVDVAGAATRRWGALLIVVLPAIPEHRDFGVVDDGRPAGVPAVATAAREAVRTRLADRPDAGIVDAEQAIRTVGARSAYHGALFRFARIPYTDPVFAELARMLAGVLRARYGATPRAVVLDADPLLDTRLDEAAAGVLADQVRLLHRAGARIGLRAAASPWETLTATLPELSADLLDAWVVDERPVREQLSALAGSLRVPVESTVLLTTGTGADADAGSVVRLGGAPESWPAELRRSGLLDRLPTPVIAPPRAEQATSPAPARSLADFVAGLDVEVDCEPVQPATLAKVIEVVDRAKDFTLGLTGVELTDPGRDVFVVRVRDRFGDYGISGAVGLRRDGNGSAAGHRVVDVFSLSCVVLGKGVQDLVLTKIVSELGPGPVVFRYRTTPHNQVATGFLAGAAASSPDIRTEEVA